MFAVISAVVVYAAPGNYVRSPGFDTVPRDYFQLMGDTAIFSLVRFFHWVTPFCLALAVVVIVLNYNRFQKQVSNDIFRNSRATISVFSSVLVAFFVSYLVRFYVLWNWIPLRTDSVSYTVFYVIVVLAGMYIGSNLDWLESTNLVELIENGRLLFLSSVLFVFFSFASNHSIYALIDDFTVLGKHYKYYQQNYTSLIDSDVESQIELPPEPRVKILRWKCYITDDKEYWVNQAVADYFGVESVVIVPTPETEPGSLAPDLGPDGCGGVYRGSSNQTFEPL